MKDNLKCRNYSNTWSSSSLNKLKIKLFLLYFDERLPSFCTLMKGYYLLFSSPAMDVILELVQLYEANYPEFLKCAYVINGKNTWDNTEHSP